ncbi:MAG: uroporphyrinogen-III synthase [Mariprofundus sp.]|nr:uroporphyrinogen-III synthase [Mariprofundus sp.]
MSSYSLEHKRVLLTRSEQHLSPLATAVSARGAVPIAFPCLQVEVLAAAIGQATGTYSDVVFSSSNGVHAVASQVDLAALCRDKRVAAVGKKTAATLQAYGMDVDIVPDIASQDGLIAAYAQHGLPQSLLFFRAEQGRDRLVKALQSQAVQVRLVLAYRTVCPSVGATDVINSLRHDDIDAVLLGSAKTARFYIQRIGSIRLADRPVLVVISEALGEAVREMGLSVQVVAKQASFEAMLDALAEYFDSSRSC